MMKAVEEFFFNRFFCVHQLAAAGPAGWRQHARAGFWL